MHIPSVRKYHYDNRFNQINPGPLKGLFYAHKSDGDGGNEPQKLTLEEAKAKLRDEGWSVMKQTSFDAIIKEKYTEAFEKAKTEYSGGKGEDAKALQTENEKLKSQIAELKKEKPEMISKSEHEQLLKVEQEKNNKAQEQINSLREHQKNNEILKVIGGKAIDSDAVLALTKDKFAIDEDGNVYPTDEKGGKLIDGEGHVTLDRFYDKFFKEKSYLAKGTDSKGAGSGTESAGNATTGGGKYSIDQLAEMSPEAFAKAGGMDALAT